MLEEKETQETNLKDLIDLVERDDLPTNEFTIEDKDPMVILGKLNEVIAYLQTLQNSINASDDKANEALQKAIQAIDDATQALNVSNGIDAKATQALANAIEAVSTANTAINASNTALSTANTAISTANTALSSANNAVETAENALNTAQNADNKAETAITTANVAKGTAEGIDAKATSALENSQTAISTANTANDKAQEALDQVVGSLGTKVYRDTALLPTLDIKPIEEQITTNTADISQALGEIAELDADKVSKVSGKQLSTEDFTTAEKNKLAGLNNYDDSQVKADITTNSQKITNLENSKADKTDIIQPDNALSSTSTNSVQNKVVTLADSQNVKLTGNQSISGVKNFSSRPQVSGTNVMVSGDSAVALKQYDTRTANSPPSYYYNLFSEDKGLIVEFKRVDAIGIPTDMLEPSYAVYCQVETHIPWPDSSGERVVQIAYSHGQIFHRYSTSNTEWSAWSEIRATYLNKFFGKNTPTHDVLFSGNVNSGNITLTNKLTNYDFIMVLSNNDTTGRAYSWRIIPVWQINHAVNTSASTFAITCGYDYWTISVSSLTSTTLTTFSENSRIREIWGVKFK